MNIPNADHPCWKIARLGIVCGTMLVFFGTIYTAPIESKDLFTIFGTLAALSGFDIGKAFMTREKTE